MVIPEGGNMNFMICSRTQMLKSYGSLKRGVRNNIHIIEICMPSGCKVVGENQFQHPFEINQKEQKLYIKRMKDYQSVNRMKIHTTNIFMKNS
jgi:hypothetical protein